MPRVVSHIALPLQYCYVGDRPTSAMLGGHYGCFTMLSEGGPSLSRCGTLHSAAQCCTVSHSATAWVQKSGIADERCGMNEEVNGSAQRTRICLLFHRCVHNVLHLCRFLSICAIHTTVQNSAKPIVSYQDRPRVDGLVLKSDIHQGSAEFHMH